MKKNEHKARAHLTRAQQFLQEKYLDALGFGTPKNIKDLPRETLEMIMRRLNLEEVSRATRVDRTFAEIGNDITGKILMKHHKYWEPSDEDEKTSLEIGSKMQCIASLSGIFERRLKYPFLYFERLYIKNLAGVFSTYFKTKPHPLSAIDLVRLCVLKYPLRRHYVLVDWLYKYLHHHSKGFKEEYRKITSAKSRSGDVNINYDPHHITYVEMKHIVDMINHNYNGYKSSVIIVSLSELADQLQTIRDHNKTIFVCDRFDSFLHVNCLFVHCTQTSSHKSVYILDSEHSMKNKCMIEELSKSVIFHSNYIFYQLDSRSDDYSTDSGALAIEDSVRLFIDPEVPHVADTREQKWKGVPVVNVKHAPGSHLLPYSRNFRTHNLIHILGENSEFVTLASRGEKHSCLLSTYKWLYKLHVARKACWDGQVRHEDVFCASTSEDSDDYDESSDSDIDSDYESVTSDTYHDH